MADLLKIAKSLLSHTLSSLESKDALICIGLERTCADGGGVWDIPQLIDLGWFGAAQHPQWPQ